mmetsp:Transcript_14368/g.58551  ORF Transcript_14368/g.58551 Transcript_14368/m.58551 type:complete len:210 (-) Transcript_14368:708-1337(-)
MYPGAAVFAPLRRHPCSHKEWSNRRRQSAPLSLQREEVLVRLQRSERDKAARRVVAAHLRRRRPAEVALREVPGAGDALQRRRPLHRLSAGTRHLAHSDNLCLELSVFPNDSLHPRIALSQPLQQREVLRLVLVDLPLQSGDVLELATPRPPRALPIGQHPPLPPNLVGGLALAALAFAALTVAEVIVAGLVARVRAGLALDALLRRRR